MQHAIAPEPPDRGRDRTYPRNCEPFEIEAIGRRPAFFRDA
jgi:hypothetical protein